MGLHASTAAQAAEPYRDAVLEHARQICCAELRAVPSHSKLLRLHALIARYQREMATSDVGAMSDDACAFDIASGSGTARRCDHELAVAELKKMLADDSTDIGAGRRLVFHLDVLGRADEAAAARLMVGIALARRERFFEAAEIYREVVRTNPTCLKALVRLGTVENVFGDIGEAIRCFGRVLALNPENTAAHIGLGWASHLAGNPARGWGEFAWYCDPRTLGARGFEQPVWDGSSLAGRRILLWAGAGYGLGDTLHLVRYAPVLKARGAHVTVECQAALVPLLAGMRGVDRVVAHGAPLPAFDVHAPLMWIPIVDPTVRTPVVADVPYVSVGEDRIRLWRRRLKSSALPTIGLTWGGSVSRRDAHVRFIPLEALAPLASIQNIRFVSLQQGPQAEELLHMPPGLRIETPLGESCSILDTAALIGNLDLVIAVDTMIVHLAGALARPVWVLLSRARDWKWGTRDDTEWYPTMRLFRQQRLGEWSEVVARVRRAIGATYRTTQ